MTCLAENVFLGIFLKELSELKPLKSNVCEESFKKLYRSLWVEFAQSSEYAVNYTVCDGSYQTSEFRGGISIVYTRALAHQYQGNKLVDSIPQISIKAEQGPQHASYYMKALELRTLQASLQGCPDESLAIYDGTLYPILPPDIAKFSDQEAEACSEWLEALQKLYEYSLNHRHLLLSISKDSRVSYARVRALVTSLRNVDPHLAEIASMEQSRKRIAEMLRGMGPHLKNYLQEFERPTSDEEVFEDLAPRAGFSKALVLAPQPIHLGEEVEAKTKRWETSVMRRRLKSSRKLGRVLRSLDHLFSLPPLAVFYWKPWHNIGTYRVDVGSWQLGVKDRWGDMQEDYFASDDAVDHCKRAVEVLNCLSKEPYAVKSLTDVDTIVRITGKTYRDCYEPLIADKLKSFGLKVRPTKRRIREMILERMT